MPHPRPFFNLSALSGPRSERFSTLSPKVLIQRKSTVEKKSPPFSKTAPSWGTALVCILLMLCDMTLKKRELRFLFSYSISLTHIDKTAMTLANCWKLPSDVSQPPLQFSAGRQLGGVGSDQRTVPFSLALKIIINTRYQVQNFSRLKKTLSMACFFLILVQKNHVLNYSTIHL